MLIAGSLGFAVLAYPLFLLLDSGSLTAAIAAHCALAAIESVYVSTAVTAGVELFATRVRYSGFSIGYNVAVAAFGGTTPYVVTFEPFSCVVPYAKVVVDATPGSLLAAATEAGVRALEAVISTSGSTSLRSGATVGATVGTGLS